MIKTTFRATISDTDLDWIQDYKEEHDLKNNAEVIHHLMKLAEENEKNSKWTKDLSDIRKQQRFYQRTSCNSNRNGKSRI